MTQDNNREKRNRKGLLIPIGVLVTAIGVVVVTRLDGFKKILQVGDELFSDDVVETGVGSRATIALADGSQLQLGSDSVATLDHEVIDPADLAGADLSLLLPPTGAGAEGEDGGQQTIAKVERNPLDGSPGDEFPLDEGLGGGAAGGEGVVMPRTDYLAVGVSGGGTEPGGGGGGGEEPPPPPPPPPELPTLSISDVTVREPASGGGQHGQGPEGQSSGPGPGGGSQSGTTAAAVFTVVLSEPAAEDVTVHYRTVDGTASAGADYQQTTDGILTIPAGETTGVISVIIFGDNLVEDVSELFTVELFNASANATIIDSTGIGEILDHESSGHAGPGAGEGGGGIGNAAEIVGTEGDDMLNDSGTDEGESGPTIAGLGGNDVLHGGEGDDQLYGGDGNDELYGSKGDDLLQGGEGEDVLLGGEGDDLLSGVTGNDQLYGGSGADQMSGGAGADLLDGGPGDDLLYGGGDDDVLLGGQGADLLVGGGGSDVFIFERNAVSEPDTIRDFNMGQDQLDISQLLDGFEEGDDLSAYVQLSPVEAGSSDYQLFVNANGSGGGFELIATLENLGSGSGTDPITADDLFTNGSLIVSNDVT